MKTTLSMLLLCSFAHAAACPTGQMKNEASLVQIEENWVRVVEQHDVPALGCILATEFEEAGATGQLIGRSQMLATAATARDAQSELSQMHAHVYGDFAYIRGVAVTRNGSQPPVKARFTDIFIYREGRWQCVAGHESRFP
jgi:ketosteroid isomerase-like protein